MSSRESEIHERKREKSKSQRIQFVVQVTYIIIYKQKRNKLTSSVILTLTNSLVS